MGTTGGRGGGRDLRERLGGRTDWAAAGNGNGNGGGRGYAPGGYATGGYAPPRGEARGVTAVMATDDTLEGAGTGGGGPPQGGRRVLIVEDDVLVGMGLRRQLERLGHAVVGQAATGGEALALFRKLQPDLVLMDLRLNDVDGIELTKQLERERRCPVVVITSHGDRDLIGRAAGEAGVFGYLIKPVTGESLEAQIEIAARRFAEHEQLLREKQELQQTLEARKVIEKAKGIFMKRLNLDEPEAHRRLQQESQKRRMSIAELAKRVIESEELFGA